MSGGKKIWETVRGLCFRGLLNGQGVETFFSLRWLVVVGLYLLATGLMAMDPWFGQGVFTYAQGGYVILISLVLVSAMSFEWGCLGRSSGGNLFLQFFLVLPMVLLLGRLIGAPSEQLMGQGETMLKMLADSFKSIAGLVGIFDAIPKPVVELFSSPRAACLFAVICLSLTAARGKILRVGLIVTTFAILFSFTFADPALAPSLVFVVGVLCLCAGVAFQFHDVSQEAVDRNIVLTLRNVTDEAERRCSIRVLKRVAVEGCVSPQVIYDIVRRCYVDEFAFAPEVVHAEVAPRLLSRLVTEHGLLEVSYVRGEARVRPLPALTATHSPWLAVALIPRCVVVGVIALIWWLTPIDLIPDAIPILGSLDDFVIVSLGGSGVIQTIRTLRSKREGALLGD